MAKTRTGSLPMSRRLLLGVVLCCTFLQPVEGKLNSQQLREQLKKQAQMQARQAQQGRGASQVRAQNNNRNGNANRRSFAAVKQGRFSDKSSFSGRENEMFAKRILARKRAEEDQEKERERQREASRLREGRMKEGGDGPELNDSQMTVLTQDTTRNLKPAKRATEKRITAIQEESDDDVGDSNTEAVETVPVVHQKLNLEKHQKMNLEKIVSEKKEESKRQHRDLIKEVEENMKKQEQKREEKREQKKEEARIDAKIEKIVAEDKKEEDALNQDAEDELKRALAEVMQIGESEVQTETDSNAKLQKQNREENHSAMAVNEGSAASVGGNLGEALTSEESDSGGKLKIQKIKEGDSEKNEIESDVDDSDKSVDNESEIQEEILDIAEDIIDNGLVNLHRQNSVREEPGAAAAEDSDSGKSKSSLSPESDNSFQPDNSFQSAESDSQSNSSASSGGLRRYEGTVIKEKMKKKIKDDIEGLINEGIEDGKKESEEKKEKENTDSKGFDKALIPQKFNTAPSTSTADSKPKHKGLKHLDQMEFTSEDGLFGSLAVDMSALRNGFKLKGDEKRRKKKKLEEAEKLKSGNRRGSMSEGKGTKGRRGNTLSDVKVGNNDFVGWKGGKTSDHGGSDKQSSGEARKQTSHGRVSQQLSHHAVKLKKQNISSHGRVGVLGGAKDNLFGKSKSNGKGAKEAGNFKFGEDNDDDSDFVSASSFLSDSDSGENRGMKNSNSEYHSDIGSLSNHDGSMFGNYSGVDTAEFDDFGIDDPDDQFAELRDLKLNDPVFKKSYSFYHGGRTTGSDKTEGGKKAKKTEPENGGGKAGNEVVEPDNNINVNKNVKQNTNNFNPKRARSSSDLRVNNGKRVKRESDLRIKANRIGDGVLQESAELVKRLNNRKHDSDKLVRQEAVDYRLKTPEDVQAYLTGNDVDPEHKLLVQKFQLTYATNCWELLNDPSLYGQLSKKIVFEMRGREDVFPSVKNPEVRKNLEVTLKRNAKVVQEYNHEVDGVLDEKPWYEGDTGKQDAEVAGMKGEVAEAPIQSDSKKKGAIVALISVITSIASGVKKVVQKGWEMFKKVMSLAVQALTWVVEGLICAAAVLYRLKGFIVLLGTAWCYEAFDSFLPESMRRVAASDTWMEWFTGRGFLTIAVPIAFNMTLPFIFGSVMSSIGASGVVGYVGSYATSAAGTIFGPLLGPLAKTGAVVRIIDLLAGGSTSMVGWACTFLQTNDGLRNALVTSAFNDANAEVKGALDCMHGIFRARRLDRTYDRERLEKLEKENLEQVEELKKKLNLSEEGLKAVKDELTEKNREKFGKNELSVEMFIHGLEDRVREKEEKEKQDAKDANDDQKKKMGEMEEKLAKQTEMMENMTKMMGNMQQMNSMGNTNMGNMQQMGNMHQSMGKMHHMPMPMGNNMYRSQTNYHGGYGSQMKYGHNGYGHDGYGHNANGYPMQHPNGQYPHGHHDPRGFMHSNTYQSAVADYNDDYLDDDQRELEEELMRNQAQLRDLNGHNAMEPEELHEERALWGGGKAMVVYDGKKDGNANGNSMNGDPHRLNPFGDTQNLHVNDEEESTSAGSVGLYHRKNPETGRFERGGRYHRRKQREMMSAGNRLKKMDQQGARAALAEQQELLKQLEERIRLKNRIMELEAKAKKRRRSM